MNEVTGSIVDICRQTLQQRKPRYDQPKLNAYARKLLGLKEKLTPAAEYLLRRHNHK